MTFSRYFHQNTFYLGGGGEGEGCLVNWVERGLDLTFDPAKTSEESGSACKKILLPEVTD